MEILHQQSVSLEQVADLCEVGIQRNQPEPRNERLWHVTNLLKASHSIVKGKPEYSSGGPASMPSIAALGRIWETAIDCYMQHFAEELDGVFVPDVTYAEDGVCGSLDGVLSLAGQWSAMSPMVHECKLRFSLNMDIPLEHLRQIRAYCHLAGTNLVCYVSGHLSTRPPLVQATLRIVRLTQQSVDETWQGIVNTKKYLESLGIGPRGGSS